MAKAILEIDLDAPQIFRPNDLILGKVRIKAKSDLVVKTLNLEFSGFVKLSIYGKNNSSSMKDVTGVKTPHSERHDFFLIKMEITEAIRETIKKNEEKSFLFKITFPEKVKCGSCGTVTNIPPSVPPQFEYGIKFSSSYKLKAILKSESEIGHSTAKAYLKYKPYGNTLMNLGKDIEKYSFKKSVEWKSKLKPFVDENYTIYEKIGTSIQSLNNKIITKEECTKAIPNPLNSPHNRTRHVRKLFGKVYNLKIYKRLVSDVNLEVELVINDKVINSVEELGSKFQLIFRSEVEDLQPDYLLFCNESSQLGKFIISNFKVSIVSIICTKVAGRKYFLKRVTDIFNTNFGNEFAFDIADFDTNKDDYKVREWNVPINRLLKNSLLNLVSSEVGPTFSSNCDFLDITHMVSLELSIAPNVDEKAEKLKFFYEVSMT